MKPVVGARVNGLMAAAVWSAAERSSTQKLHLQPLGAGCPTLDPQPQHLHANTTPGAHDERRPSWRPAALSLGQFPAIRD